MSDFPFSGIADLKPYLDTLPQPDETALRAARSRNDTLTKPSGALGRLEELAIWYAGWRGDARPTIERPQVLVFAGNHGVTAQGISLFPADVTAQMVLNFEAGGAAINQICQSVGADLTVRALDLDRPTQDFSQGPAMSEGELLEALSVGWASVSREADLVVPGEMGIGNTTSAAALALALFGGDAGDWAGRGTGLDDAGVQRKADLIERAVALHGNPNGFEALRCLGGRELAAMVGAVLRARQERIPVLVDGFICTAALACLFSESADALSHCQAGHQSAEGAHPRLLDHLGLNPLLSLGLRLGEGSGGALSVAVLKAAIACHSGMASFAEAGVSEE